MLTTRGVQRQEHSTDAAKGPARASTRSPVGIPRYLWRSLPQSPAAADAQPLEPGVRTRMERAFGVGFEQVRVHTGPAAQAETHARNAHAFTTGTDVSFASGRYRPATPDGQQLLAHELAHVVQQTGGSRKQLSAGTSAPSALEREAAQAAEQVSTFGSAPPLSASAPAVQRQEASTPTLPTSTAGTQRGSGPPVIFGLDISSQPQTLYMSVTPPGQSLADVATYLYGSPAAASALSQASGGLPEQLTPGTVLRPTGQPLADGASAALERALESGFVLRSRGTPTEAPAGGMVYTFQANGQTYQLTETMFEALRRGVGIWMVRRARLLVESADFTLTQVRQNFLDTTNSVVRGISNLMGGTSVPEASLWSGPRDEARALLGELDGVDVPTQGQVGVNLGRLERASQGIAEADLAWRRYIQATSEGAESSITGLTVVRNVSFGIAAGIAGAVAAPAVFGVAAGAFGTGTAGTLLAGGTAVAGGALAGGTVHGGLEFSATTLDQISQSGPMNWGEVGQRTLQGFTSGLGEGALGALSFFGSSALAARLGPQFASTLGGRMAIGGMTGAGAGFLASSLEAIFHPTDTPAWQRILVGTLMGAGFGSAFGALPIQGLYRSGGRPLNPFSGEAVTPRWMLQSPWSVVQNNWNPPADFHTLPRQQLPPLPEGYTWAQLNGEWVPLRPPGLEQPLQVRIYGPDASGRYNYNLLTNGRLLGSSAFTRPTGSTYGGSRREMPFDPVDFEEPTSGNPNIIGHNVDFADTMGAPNAPGNSNADPLNYTPEAAWWGLRVRNPLVARIRAAGGGYRQMNDYGPTPQVTRSGVPIPRGVFFVETDAAGAAVQAWYVPFNAHPYNYSPGAGNAFATLAPFAIPLTQVPPALLSPPPNLTGGAAGVAGAHPESTRR